MAILKLLTAPTQEPVTLDDLKVALRLNEINEIDMGGISAIIEDSYLNGLIKTARVMVESLCGPLFTQTWEQYQSEWPEGDNLRLWKPRVQSVTSVIYTDIDDTATTFDSDYYTADIINDERPGIVLNYGYSWPNATLHPSNPIKITFICGFGDAPEDIEQPIIDAIYMICSHLYENREMFNISISGNSVVPIPWTAEMLLSPYRTWNFEAS